MLPYEEFVALQEVLADYEDLVDLRAANEGDAPSSIPLSKSSASSVHNSQATRLPIIFARLESRALVLFRWSPAMPFHQADT